MLGSKTVVVCGTAWSQPPGHKSVHRGEIAFYPISGKYYTPHNKYDTHVHNESSTNAVPVTCKNDHVNLGRPLPGHRCYHLHS